MDPDCMPHARALIALVHIKNTNDGISRAKEEEEEEERRNRGFESCLSIEDVSKSIFTRTNLQVKRYGNVEGLERENEVNRIVERIDLCDRLNVTKANEWINERATSKRAVVLVVCEYYEVLSTRGPLVYARFVKDCEVVIERASKDKAGVVFCIVSGNDEDEDVTYAIDDRAVEVLRRVGGQDAKIVSLTRRTSESRDACLKRLSDCCEASLQEVYVKEANRNIRKYDQFIHKFEQSLNERRRDQQQHQQQMATIDEVSVVVQRAEAKAKATRYLFKVASFAEFRGDKDAALNALEEAYKGLVAYVDVAVRKETREHFFSDEKRFFKLAETLRVLVYCRSRISSIQLGKMMKMDADDNESITKIIQELIIFEKQHALHVAKCLSKDLFPSSSSSSDVSKFLVPYCLALRAKADKAFADVLAHTMHANPNVYEALFNDNNIQFQRGTTQQNNFDLRLDPGFYYRSAFDALFLRREYVKSLMVNVSVAAATQNKTTDVTLIPGKFLGTYVNKEVNVIRDGHSYLENHTVAQVSSADLQSAYLNFENQFSPLEMLEKAKAYFEGNPRYSRFFRMLTAVSSDYALELFYANNTQTNSEKILNILLACAEIYRKERWYALLEQTLERILTCLGDDVNGEDEVRSKHRVQVLLELHGAGHTRASSLLIEKVAHFSNRVVEITKNSVAIRAFQVSYSFGYDLTHDAVRAGDTATLAVQFNVKGLNSNLFAVARIEAFFSNGSKASSATAADNTTIGNNGSLTNIAFTVQQPKPPSPSTQNKILTNRTQNEDFILEVDTIDIVTKSGITFKFQNASLGTLLLPGHARKIFVKELAPRAKLVIENSEHDDEDETILFGETKTLTIAVTAVDSLSNAIVNLSIDESLREISLAEDDDLDNNNKNSEVVAKFDSPRVVIGTLMKGETKRVQVTATFFSSQSKSKKSRATISAHLTCSGGGGGVPGQQDEIAPQKRVVAAESSKTFVFTDPLEVLDSVTFSPCGSSPVSILVKKDDEDSFAAKFDRQIQLNNAFGKAPKKSPSFNEGDLRLTRIRAKAKALTVVDNKITTRLEPGDVYTQIVITNNNNNKEEDEQKKELSVSWSRATAANDPALTTTTTNMSNFALLLDEQQQQQKRGEEPMEIMTINSTLPNFIQVGVAFDYVIEIRNLDPNVPLDFTCTVKDASGFVLAGETETRKTANPNKSSFLHLKVVAVASGERQLPLVTIKCPKLVIGTEEVMWTNVKQQSVVVFPVGI